MRDNYLFILPTRASHFRYVRKTISIPKNLGHQCDWRTCAVDVAFLTRRENFGENLSAALDFLSLPTPPKDPSIGLEPYP
jgi:hypothetical protein